MLQRIKKFFSGFSTTPAAPPPVRSRKVLDAEKQQKLNKLCEQLLTKKSLITSGKIQFMGLTKIKKRLGKRWEGLSNVVYNAVEEVFKAHLDKGDVYIRYHDEAYVLLFAHDDKEQARTKAEMIADEIRKKLFRIDEKELRTVEVRQAINQIKASSLRDNSFTDFLDSFASNDEPFTIEDDDFAEATENEGAAENLGTLEIDTRAHREKSASGLPPAPLPEQISYSYLPLWDVRRTALTTYLCLPHAKGEDPFASYKAIFRNRSREETAAIDFKLLEAVREEITAMSKDGRKFLIACPVQNETLHNFETFEEYKKQLQAIPRHLQQYLVLVVANINGTPPRKDPYWFSAPLRAYSHEVFVEVPLRRDININYLKSANVECAGMIIDGHQQREEDVIQTLNVFAAKARTFKLPATFVLGVSTLSLTTSAVCAGFNYLGGPAIHDYVERPDSVHQYKYQDLMSSLILDQK